MVDVKLEDNERQACEIWTRVMGYHRPVDSFNRGKKSEYYSRKCFSEDKAVSHINAENYNPAVISDCGCSAPVAA